MPSDSPLLPSPRELLGPEISPRLEQLTPPGQKIKLAGGRDQERLRVSGPKEQLPPARRVNPLGDNRPGTRTADRVGPGHDPSALPAPIYPNPSALPAPYPGGGGGGGTDSLHLGTDLETTAPPPLLFFWSRTAPGSAISKFTAPSFHGRSRTAPSNCQFSMNLFIDLI